MKVLLVEDRGAVRLLTMNRPEKRNALNSELTQALLDALRAADVHDTCLVGPAALPIRQLKNAFTQKFQAAREDEREALFKASSLKKAALEGDVEWGKVEAGQSAGLVDEILPAAELMKRLVQELEQARNRLASL